MSNKITVTINGQEYSYLPGQTYQSIARDFKDQYPHEIILARVNGRLRELMHTCEKDCSLDFITTGEKSGIQVYQRTACMVMYKAFEDVLGKERIRKLDVEYSLSDGLFCTLQSEEKLTATLLKTVKKQMKKIVEEKLPIQKKRVQKQEAIDLYNEYNMPDKAALFAYRVDSIINYYILDKTVDYYYGYMAPDTSYIRYFELYLYKNGFVLQLPTKEAPETLSPFDPPETLFTVLHQSTSWGELMNVRTVADLNNEIAKGHFNDLVLMQEALMEKQIGLIAERIAAEDKRLILIAGPSSSGKTTFSHRLSIQLRATGLKPHPIAVDNYFVDRAHTPLGPDGKPNYECLEAVDVERFNSDMKRLLAGEYVNLPVFNFITGEREENKSFLQLEDKGVLVIEGIHALNDAMTFAFPAEEKFKIYISALTQINMDDHARIHTTDARLIRRMCRDFVTRGHSAKHTLELWPSVRRGEEENIFPYQESCDIMFNSALIYELAVLKQYAVPLLFSITPDMPEYDEANRLLKFFNYFLGVTSEHIPFNSVLREFIGGSCFNVG